MRLQAQKFTKTEKWILILVYGSLLLGLVRLFLDCTQADWIVRRGDLGYGIKAIKSDMFLLFGGRRMKVSGAIDFAVIVMPTIGVVMGAGIWILRKLRNSALENADRSIKGEN